MHPQLLKANYPQLHLSLNPMRTLPQLQRLPNNPLRTLPQLHHHSYSLHPSTLCGPYHNYTTTYSVISDPVRQWKQNSHTSKISAFIVDIIASTAFIVAIFILLWLATTIMTGQPLSNYIEVSLFEYFLLLLYLTQIL